MCLICCGCFTFSSASTGSSHSRCFLEVYGNNSQRLRVSDACFVAFDVKYSEGVIIQYYYSINKGWLTLAMESEFERQIVLIAMTLNFFPLCLWSQVCYLLCYRPFKPTDSSLIFQVFLKTYYLSTNTRDMRFDITVWPWWYVQAYSLIMKQIKKGLTPVNHLTVTLVS